MKKYRVSFVRIVEAHSEQEAKELALENSRIPDTLEVESELDVEELLWKEEK